MIKDETNYNSNNRVTLVGEITEEPSFSHELFGEAFYDFEMSVPRLSGQIDRIPITISERLLDENFVFGNEIALVGQFRSYNKLEEGRSRLMLTVFVRELITVSEAESSNAIELSGYICRAPIHRITPFKREISDVLVAVNRAYNKSDYIPCIAWGRNARFVSSAEVGDRLSLVGRIQSREYQKTLSNGDIVTKTAYEVSINRLALGSEEYFEEDYQKSFHSDED